VNSIGVSTGVEDALRRIRPCRLHFTRNTVHDRSVNPRLDLDRTSGLLTLENEG
jgi:hypothetical protein